MSTTTVDNLLFFVASNFDSLDRNKIHSTLVHHYNQDQLVTSKRLLVAECDRIKVGDAISEFKRRRLNTISDIDTKRKLSKDILDIWSVVDCQKGGQFQTLFVADDPPLLPSSFPLSVTAPLFSPAAPAVKPKSKTTTTTTTTNTDKTPIEPNLECVIALLQSLRDDFTKQQESIQWLTNLVSNTYRRLDSTSGDSSVVSVLNESVSHLSKTPRSLPKAPTSHVATEREKLRGKRKCLSSSSSFIPHKQTKVTPGTSGRSISSPAFAAPASSFWIPFHP